MISGCYNSARHWITRPWSTMNLLLRLSLLGLFALLIGCAQRPPASTEPSDFKSRPLPADAREALTQLSGLSATVARDQALAWAERFLANQQLRSTDTLLGFLDGQPLTANQRAQRALLRGQWHLAQSDPAAALTALNDINLRAVINQVEPALTSRIGLLRADALTLQGELLASLQQRVTVDALLTGDNQQYNRQMIWTQLMLLPHAELRNAMQGNRDSVLGGWLELAELYRDPLSDIDGQLKNLDLWQQRRADHPAARAMPSMVRALRQAVRERPETVAVLLPRSGPLAAPAEAIRHGILASYYSALEQGHPVPALHFLDTSEADIISVYNQALALGAGLVIGPLDKAKAGLLADIADLPVTTLALNYIDRPATASRLFQFGLAPEDEARQVAEQALNEGLGLAAVLYPQDSSGWGLRVATAFSEHFQALGGTLVGQSHYADDATSASRALLGIQQSENRARELRRLTGRALEFEPRRRQDLDLIFLVASSAQARQVKPALNFHFASDVPVFATSHVYGGSPAADRDGDLNGIRFVDIPWLLEDASPLHDYVAAAWPDGHGRFERLFAMGVDAYRLHARLMLLDTVPDSFLPGVTGQLSVNSQRMLQRRLNWAWFQRGLPRQMPVVAGNRRDEHGRSQLAPATR